MLTILLWFDPGVVICFGYYFVSGVFSNCVFESRLTRMKNHQMREAILYIHFQNLLQALNLRLSVKERGRSQIRGSSVSLDKNSLIFPAQK